MRKLLTLALLLGLDPVTGIQGEEAAINDGTFGKVSYYMRAFKLERDSFLKALGVDPKTVLPQAVFIGGPYGTERPVGSGVLLPDDEDGMFPSTRPQTRPKLQKAGQ